MYYNILEKINNVFEEIFASKFPEQWQQVPANRGYISAESHFIDIGFTCWNTGSALRKYYLCDSRAALLYLIKLRS